MRCFDLLLPISSSGIMTVTMGIKTNSVQKATREGKIFILILRYNVSSPALVTTFFERQFI